ncbi:hypothetical protein R6Q59_013591 [Mikania micrantha]|uniref:Transcription repressor n=1 Tax=Mikania micrantha TaxID=192012 RepID=A0A5N6P4B6_9ASTR|nr:hypothetical protein E3N88_11978 [Mikania micrantha]
MGRKFSFLPNCGSTSKNPSVHTAAATATATVNKFADTFATGDVVSSVEPAIRRLSTDRLFFKPETTSSILEEAKPVKKEKEKEDVLPLKESVSMMKMESSDPFVDFKKSIQEMMEADNGLKESWENLQQLLNLYLAVNDSINHGYIVGAFIDLLLVDFGSSLPSSCSSSSSSSINDQETSMFMEPGSNRCNNNKNKTMIGNGSTKSALSFTSSSASASTSGTNSSTHSHCLSLCSLENKEEEDDDNHI